MDKITDSIEYNDDELNNAKKIYHKMVYLKQKQRLQEDIEFKEKIRLYSKNYNKHTYKTDPEKCEKQKQRARDYYEKNKERIIEERKRKYQEKKLLKA